MPTLRVEGAPKVSRVVGRSFACGAHATRAAYETEDAPSFADDPVGVTGQGEFFVIVPAGTFKDEGVACMVSVRAVTPTYATETQQVTEEKIPSTALVLGGGGGVYITRSGPIEINVRAWLTPREV